MRIFAFLQSILAGALMGCMLVFPREAAQAALSALSAFATHVLPGLLPFSVCAPLVTAGHSLPLPAALLLALPGGSPSGARLFQQAALSPRQAKRAAAATGVIGPMFFLFTLSRWLGSAAQGRLLLASHLLSALLVSCLYRQKGADQIKFPPLSLPQALASGGQAMATAAACVALGAVAGRMLGCAFPILPSFPLAILQSLLEITSGLQALIPLGPPLPLIAALTGFTSLSILLQNAACWQAHGLSLGALVKIALLRAGIAAGVCVVLESML